MLDALQAQLEALYGIRCEYRARDFLVDAESAKALGGTGRAREELLVSSDGESVDLALYLEPALLERVSRLEHQPEALLDQELGGFCEVTEGRLALSLRRADGQPRAQGVDARARSAGRGRQVRGVHAAPLG
jgi:hypothetical protein